MQYLHSVTFSIPEEKITDKICKKTKIISDLIPGKLKTYIYNNEADYYDEYKKSLFATTCKKAGWDCLRHYEILANGCIPYFPNIEDCPENTMALLPKNLIINGNNLYKKYLDENELDVKQCHALIAQLLNYTKLHLTTQKMAQYILDTSDNNSAATILYLSKEATPDYLRCLTLHGFKILFGDKCHDFPKIPHIYKSNAIQYKRLYGKGISYTNLLKQELHNDNLDNTLVDDIKTQKYDVIIYGSYHRGMPYYDIIQEYYPPNKIILLCGEDIHNCNHDHYVNKHHHVFVRELT